MLRNNGRSHKIIDLPSSDEESVDSDMLNEDGEDEDYGRNRRTRSTRANQKKQKRK